MNPSTIPTIILCGGSGTRLREETEFKPKPMVQVGDKPLLWHIMKIYGHFGHKNFILALGYKGEMIKDYFLQQRHYNHDFLFSAREGQVTRFFNPTANEDDFNIIFGETGLQTPHGERVLKLKEYITEDVFMVTYGDGVADINIEKLLAFHKSHGKMATITGVHPASRWGLVNSSPDGIVTEFSEKPMLHDYVNGGFMVFNKEFLNVLQPGDLIEHALERLIPKQQVALYKHEGFWFGMDTYKDFLHLNELWDKDPKWKIWNKQGDTNLRATSESTNKTVLVTGGAGFIGSNLVEELMRQGQRVVVIDNVSGAHLPAGAIFYKADIRDKNISDIFQKEKPSIVFHLAAKPIVQDVYNSPMEAIETNIMGTVNILEACRGLNNVESIIVASSDKAYGKAQHLPYSEQSPLKGDHPYDVSKSSADLIAQTYAKTYGMPVLVTRFSNVFGPGDRNLSRIIPGIMESLTNNTELLIRSDGTMIREYTYVKDVVDGYIKLANHKKNFGEAFNFGSKNICSVLEVIKTAELALGRKINYKILNTAKNEIPEQYLDWTKARELLGWEPKTSLEEGIKETFHWYKNRPFTA